MSPEPIRLVEYVPRSIPAQDFSEDLARLLLERFPTQILVEPPSFLNHNQWRLTSLGYVGIIPLTPDVQLILEPKVSIGNLFRMLEYAYRVNLTLMEDLFDVSSIEDLYERLAIILSRKILDRGRKGFYRAYIPESQTLPYLREQMNINQQLRTPWAVNLTCDYHEHTADNTDNQILAWTLEVILRSGICSERGQPIVRRAYREIENYATPRPMSASDCLGRLYNRLNQDYQPLHALCLFFLEHTGPGHQIGDRSMVPFLIDMNVLFEVFVAEWLDRHLADPYQLQPQYQVTISEANDMNYRIDLVILDANTGRARVVLDTKYKKPDNPSLADVNQALGYALSMQCQEAVLIYPTPPGRSLDTWVGGSQHTIHVRSLVFDLSKDLEQSGALFLHRVFGDEFQANNQV